MTVLRQSMEVARALLVAGLLAGCVAQVTRHADGGGEPPAEFPGAHYLQAAARGQPVFEVDPASSLVVIEVRRGGALAQLGHDHVIASHDVRGYVAPADARADLYLRLDRLVVDEPELRTEARFVTQPSDEAIAGTRTNMLGKLGADTHPWALVAVRDVRIDTTGTRMNATITLNGIARAMSISPEIVFTGEDLNVSGRVALEQTNFGITPFSILGGALQVQDQVAIRFRIRALRLPS